MADHGTSIGRRGDAAEDARVRAAAVRLFAELGYDMVSTQMIADAAGVDQSTVADRHGGKRALYVTSMNWAAQQWQDQVQSMRGDYTPDVGGLIRFVDRYLEYCREHPELPRLLVHRWFSDARDVAGINEEIIVPRVREAVEVVRSALGPDADPEAALWTLGWSIYGYLQSGYLDESGERRTPDDPQTLRRFRHHLRWLIHKMAATT
ncbi:TetR/AcrR family transcriptional regulator [Actinomadura rugatobispora]|uniref:TetR/AcrR family transcriptional regulator n=1 Tax=Actinomadura rugatobispora TaxID=1994 RepID=A0ABW0ZRT8_9ACTN